MVHKVYHRIDAWRGYYTYEPTVDQVRLGSDDDALLTECHFVPHDDNDAFINITKRSLRNLFDLKISHGQTSNVFSMNVMVIAKPKQKWSHKLKTVAKKVDELFVNYYTRGFSIMSGDTYPIDLVEYEKELKEAVKDGS